MAGSPVYLAVVGTGGVGHCFLKQLSQLPASRQLALILVSRSSGCLLSKTFRPLDLSCWESALSSSAYPVLAIHEIINYLSRAPGKVIFVDNTSSQDIADAYPAFLRHGISVVTPNKKAFSGSMALWEEICCEVEKKSALCYFETTVGASFPVISTLRELLATGDEVLRIEGTFSGTLSYLFNSFSPVSTEDGDKLVKWSDGIRCARDLGYTEPDPRDDLSGLDVARKLTILARVAGLKIPGPTSFSVESLIPPALEKTNSVDEFMERLAEFDDSMERRRKEAEEEGRVLRYVGSIDVIKGDLNVGIQRLEKSHPIGMMRGNSHIIRFYTKRYGDLPLVIQGSGNGEVTAMSVTNGVLKLLHMLL